MNKSSKSASGVVPDRLVKAAAGLAAVLLLSTSFSNTKANTFVAPAPHRGFTAADSTRWQEIYDPPAQQPEKPVLWTVRTRFDALIKTTAKRHDVDAALVKAIVQAESAFNPNAVSRSGAKGLMQVLPETASRFSISNLSDPRQNLQAGVMYLKYLLDLFDGDVTKAVAAYNAGPNVVRRHRGVPPYTETKSYITKVMGLRDAYARPAQRS